MGQTTARRWRPTKPVLSRIDAHELDRKTASEAVAIRIIQLGQRNNKFDDNTTGRRVSEWVGTERIRQPASRPNPKGLATEPIRPRTVTGLCGFVMFIVEKPGGTTGRS